MDLMPPCEWIANPLLIILENHKFLLQICTDFLLSTQIGTSIMYIGLTLTYVSSFQMFRGSIIIFVAVLSMTFLDRRIIRREWAGIGKSTFILVFFSIEQVANKQTSHSMVSDQRRQRTPAFYLVL